MTYTIKLITRKFETSYKWIILRTKIIIFYEVKAQSMSLRLIQCKNLKSLETSNTWIHLWTNSTISFEYKTSWWTCLDSMLEISKLFNFWYISNVNNIYQSCNPTHSWCGGQDMDRGYDGSGKWLVHLLMLSVYSAVQFWLWCRLYYS